ncbi:sensor histidine kinase [Maribacter sp. X9]|uniref:sensor histidine kinase n=1 Tax=Maribacter sp. X9 TaxID=3402159 RepID=UPI003AF374D2
MLEEIYDSLDDGLENQKILMVQRAGNDPTILAQNDPEFKEHVYNFTPISKKGYQNFKESYRDTSMYMLNEKSYEPVRIYESAVKYGDGHYKLKIITSMVEEDDLVEDMILYLSGLYILLVASILFLNNLLLRRIWKPFYNLITQLRDFRIENNTAVEIPKSNIEEFNLLNSTVDKLIKKSTESYVAQKQFIENASHELQTPLAISINKLELFLENNDLDENQLKDLSTVMDSLSKLTRLNKSLLLLSKIENKQFEEEAKVDFTELTKHILEDFKDMAVHKKMRFKIVSNEVLKHFINEDLAIILLTNLIKNALVHGKQNEDIQIKIGSDSWQIRNFGILKELDQKTMFARFKNSANQKNSTGLGLAIAKAISEKYKLELIYSFEGVHTFKLKFPKRS